MDKRTKHGMWNHPLYNVWNNMMQRCYSEKCVFYHDYGKRGILVDPRWHDPRIFIADMGPRPTEGTLDRIDNNRGYSKENCRWVTQTTQGRNRRNNRIVDLNGEAKCVSEWCEKLGLNYKTIMTRLHRGWPPKLALAFDINNSNGGRMAGEKRRKKYLPELYSA